MLIVPPGPASDGVEVELRVGVREAEREGATVEFRVGDDPPVVAEADGSGLARTWVSTQGRSGTVDVGWRIIEDRASGSASFDVLPSTTRAPTQFGGLWLSAGGLNVYPRDGEAQEGDVRAMVAAMHELGARLVVFTYVEYLGGFYYPSSLEFFDRDAGKKVSGMVVDFDAVGAVMQEAERLGMGVMLGLGRGGDTPLLWDFDAQDWEERNRVALDLSRAVVDELWALYGHHRSLYGWYLTHEMNDLARSRAYYDPIARYCKEKAVEKVVMVAPAGTPVLTPADLRETDVDIFAYQDAVGSGYVPYENTWDPERRIAMLDEVYATYRQVHEGTGKHLWADVELWEMDGSQGYGGSYPAAWSRVRRQMDLAAPHVTYLTGYEYTGFLEHPDTRVKLLDRRAAALYEGLHQHRLEGPAS